MTDDKKIIEQTIADYNLIAAKFSSTRSSVPDDVKKLAAMTERNAQVLDYGCGNGRLSQFFDRDSYLGADPSSGLIREARGRYPGYKFTLIKPNSVPRLDSIDAIYCLAVLHHLPSTQSQLLLLRKLHHTLMPRGRLFLTVWNVPNNHKSPAKIVEIPFKYDDGKIVRQLYAFTLGELSTLVRQSGFTVTSAKIVPRNRGVYSNIEIVATKIE